MAHASAGRDAEPQRHEVHPRRDGARDGERPEPCGGHRSAAGRGAVRHRRRGRRVRHGRLRHGLQGARTPTGHRSSRPPSRCCAPRCSLAGRERRRARGRSSGGRRQHVAAAVVAARATARPRWWHVGARSTGRFRWRRSPSSSPRRPCWWRSRKRPSRLDQPGDPRARRCATSWPTRRASAPKAGSSRLPGRRRIYSNAGFEQVADTRCAAPPRSRSATIWHEGVLRTARHGTRRAWTARRPAARSRRSSDLALLAGEVLAPSVLDPLTLGPGDVPWRFPGSTASCPGSAASHRTTGAWGSRSAARSRRIGPRRRTVRPRSVTSARAARSCGWIPVPGVALVCLTDLDFGPWAVPAWPAFGDAVLRELRV